LSLLLVLVLSFGAAAQLKLSGLAEFHFGLRQKKDGSDLKGLEFFGKGRRNIDLTFTAPSGSAGNLRLTLSLGRAARSGAAGANDFFDWTTDAYNPGAANAQLNLTSARISGTGALWKGGPPLTVTAGRYNAGYSPWVAHTVGRRGDENENATAFLNSVEVKGLNVGPFAISAIHGHSVSYSAWGQDEPTYLHASGTVGGISTKLTAVDREVIGKNIADRDRVWDFAAELGMKPMADLSVDAVVAMDGQGQGADGIQAAEVAPKLAVRADAKYTGIAATTIDASVWRTEDLFAPRYAQWSKNDGGFYTKFDVNRQGVKVGASTTQAGVDLKGSYELVSEVSGANYDKSVITAGVGTKVDIFTVSADVTLTDENSAKSTKTVLKASTKLADVDLAYTGEINKAGTNPSTMKNTISATTKQNLFFADNVTLNATVINETDKDLLYGADAKWTAPIGLDIAVGYANYKKSPRNYVHGHQQKDGFYVTASKLITF